jgi:hypothetical protein
MKRPRDDDLPLGATELAAILNNGEDPAALYRGLARFVRTVRRERRLALGSPDDAAGQDDDDDASHHKSDAETDEDDLDDEPPPAEKKLKKEEAWKADTAAYDVPYVGTSVAAHQAAPIVQGQWPTGLLRAYLLKSPRAVELTSDQLVPWGISSRVHKLLLRQKKGRLSQAIYKQYLRAVAELLTAALPRTCLLEMMSLESVSTNDDPSVDDQDNNPWSLFVRELLKERLAGYASLLRDETGNGKGKVGTAEGGCGGLAPLALQVLTRLAQTSTESARQVLRALPHESVWRFLLRPQLPVKGSVREKSRYAALVLTTALTNTADPVVLASIASPGVRDRRLAPGLLYLALKEMAVLSVSPPLPEETAEESSPSAALCKNLLAAQGQVLVALRHVLSQVGVEFFSHEIVQQMGKLAVAAPPLSEGGTFRSVLEQTDFYDEDDGGKVDQQPDVIESRRLLLMLLDQAASRKLRLHASIAVRGLTQLLIGGNAGLEMRAFVLHCLHTNPFWLLPFVQSFTVGSNREDFGLLAQINFLSKLMRQGPAPQYSRGRLLMTAEEVALQILPLKKQSISKALQSTNGVVLSQTIYLLLHSLRRFAKVSGTVPEELRADLGKILVNSLPEGKALVKICSRLQDDGPDRHAYLIGLLSELFTELARSFPVFIQSNVDPSRLLPKDASTFGRMPAFIQWKLLGSLRELHEKDALSKQTGTKTFRVLLEICMNTKHKRVYLEARRSAISFLRGLLEVNVSQDAERLACFEYEIGCWVDGLSLPVVSEFCQQLQVAVDLPVGGVLDLVRAWKEVGQGIAPKANVSAVLIHLLKEAGAMSSGLSRLTLQVACKCLLFHTDPRTMACLVVFYAREASNENASRLAVYAATILDPFVSTSVDSLALLKDCLVSLFYSESTFLQALSGKEFSVTKYYVDGLTRMLSHLATVAGVGTDGSQPYIKLVRRCTLLSLQHERNSANQGGSLDVSRDSLGDSTFIAIATSIACLQDPAARILTGTDSFVEALSTGQVYAKKEVRLIVVLSSILCEILPPTTVCCRFAALVHYLSESNHGSQDTFMKKVAHAYSRVVLEKVSQQSDRWTEESIRHLWKAWQKLDVKVNENIGRALHVVVAHLIQGSSPQSTPLLLSMEAVDPEKVITRTIEMTMLSSSGDASHTFIPRLLLADAARYGAAFSKRCNESIVKNTLTDLYRHDRLDESLVVLFSGSTSMLDEVLLVSAIEDCVDQLVDPESSCSAPLFTLSVLDAKRCSHLSYETHLKLFQALGLICDRLPTIRRADCSAVMTLLAKFIPLIYQSKGSSVEQGRAIGSKAFVSLAHVLNLEIKQSKKSNPAQLVKLMGEACRLVVEIKGIASSPLREHAESVLSMIRRSLKLGLSPSTSPDCKVESSSLRFLRSLVSSEGKHSWFSTVLQEGSLSSLILKLSTSHSNFANLMTLDDPTRSEQRFEVIMLFLSCLLNAQDCSLTKDDIEKLQFNSQASATREDQAIRGIVQLSSENTGRELYLDDMLWQDAPRALRGSPDDTGWDWLPSSIKTSRVFATLRLFPVEDDVVPASHEKLNEWVESLDFLDAVKDDRYSPGFLLPLILASLEHILEIPEDGANGTTPNALLVDVNKIGLSAVHFAQRICEAGCMSLSVAGLCSHSSSVRELAVSILFLLTVIIHSETAKKLTQWRERPQVCMFLDSVQRALAIQRSDPARGNFSTDSDGLIPWVNPLAAIFLARTAMVLARPGDPLYSAANRYFLRVAGEHGAFPDLNRLPAFMSLFCTAAEDPKQAEHERLWALEVLRDGFCDDRCFRPVMACHAPELLLSTISMRLGTDMDGEHARELELLLSNLLRILVVGGPRARGHMISRMGLLSWLGGVLGGRPVAALHGQKGCAMLFLGLLGQALQGALEISNDWEREMQGLARPTLELWNAVASGNQAWNFTAEGLAAAVPVSSLLSRILLFLGQTRTRHHDASPSDNCLEPRLVLQVLSKLSFDNAEECWKVLQAVCRLPLCKTGESTMKIQLAENFLQLAVTTSLRQAPPEEALLQLLYTVDSLVTGPTPGVVTLLCQLRSLCSREDATRLAWHTVYRRLAPL